MIKKHYSFSLLVKKLYICITILFITTDCLAISFIRDSEIENVIMEVATPVIKAAGLKNKNIKFYILHDPQLNAFTTGGGDIYLNSGLITNFDDPDILRGVISHEIGHLTGHHLSRQSQNIQDINKIAVSSIVLGIAVAAFGGTHMSGDSSASLGQAIAMGGMHISQQTFLAYSRKYESSADQAAFKYLEKSGHSTIGMLKLFEKLGDSEKKYKNLSPYETTHPISQYRLSSVKNFISGSKYKTSQNNEAIKYKFKKVTAKLRAFVEKPENTLKQYKNDNSEIALYAKTIAQWRAANRQQALTDIELLLQKHPNNPYYHELKGQMLFEFGNKTSLASYNHAINLAKDDLLLRTSRAIVNLESSQGKPNQQTYDDLMFVFAKEPKNLLLLHYLSIYYERNGEKAKAILMIAKKEYYSGNITEAARFANIAAKQLPKDTPLWLQAQDIIALSKNTK